MAASTHGLSVFPEIVRPAPPGHPLARNRRREIDPSHWLDPMDAVLFDGVFGERSTRESQRIGPLGGVHVPVRVDGDTFTGDSLV